MFGFYRVATVAPKLFLANPLKNVDEIISSLESCEDKNVSIANFGELTLIGYSVGDLIFNTSLLNAQDLALKSILEYSRNVNIIFTIGYALKYKSRLYNTALVIKNGEILGVVPKTYIPNKQEFYEARYFSSGRDIKNEVVNILSQDVPFGIDLLFSDSDVLTFGVEICEDLWAVTPPSNILAQSGANLILNLSASNEIIGKDSYRVSLVSSQSARLICVYAYASSSLGESGSDTIFGGDLIISEYGTILKRDKNLTFNSKLIYADVDINRVSNLRVNDSSFNQSSISLCRSIEFNSLNRPAKIDRFYNPHPFIPNSVDSIKQRSEEITNIQAYALIRRMRQANIKRALIGISGGLDSTLALLSTHKAFIEAKWDIKDIVAVTMPGFGTTSKTLSNAKEICKILGVTLKEIDIKELATQELKTIDHDLETYDITYENTQARLRTAILMNLSNKLNGLVVGTGDLSEIALGWSTYNGDHMSMFGLNSGIPKTLIKYLISYYAKGNLEVLLKDILDTPVSPELIPAVDDKIVQATEEIVGPYELHDFFLYHFIRDGFSPKKIFYIASLAFKDKYSDDTIKRWLKLFIKRFFTQQFKRNAMPDGVMIGTVSLSPRANWRMPSDLYFDSFLEELN